MHDKNRDRGTKKWSMAMMLPEHTAALREWMDEDNYVERPQLDDFELQSIQENIEIAYKRQCMAHVATWSVREIHHFGGEIIEINMQSRILILDTPFGIERLSIADIVGVHCKD